MLLVYLTLTTFLVANAEINYNLTTLKNNPGIYYEKLQDVKFSRSNWKILTFIDIQPFNFNGTHLHEEINRVNKSCQFEDSDHVQYMCTLITGRLRILDVRVTTLTQIYDDLIDAMREVEPLTPSDATITNSIKKRQAAFGFIGSVSRTLFGTLTEDDGKFYDRQINQLFKGQVDLAKLSKEETHIIQHRLSSVSTELNDMKRQLNESIISFNKTIVGLDNLYEKWNRFKWEIQMNEVVSNLESLLNLYQTTFSTLLAAVQAARIGHLHPSLLPTNQLQKIMRQVADLHLDYEFPIPIEHARADKLGNIATVRLAYKNKKFLAEINIPMLSNNPSELFKIHSIPIPQHNENQTISAYIQPRSDYIYLSHGKRAYSLITKSDLSECKNSGPHFVCQQNQPTYEAGGEMACEYLLLTQPNGENLRSCDIKITPQLKTHWTRLSSMDGWLYSTVKATPIQILCPGESPQPATIDGVGIIYLKPRCSISEGHTTLVGTKELGQSEDYQYLPPISLNIIDIEPQIFDKLATLKQFRPNFALARQDSDLSLEKLRETYDMIIKEQSNHEVHTYHQYGTGLLLFIVTIIVVALCTFNLCNRNKHTIKLPRLDGADFQAMKPLNMLHHPNEWKFYKGDQPNEIALDQETTYRELQELESTKAENIDKIKKEPTPKPFSNLSSQIV